MTRTEICSYLRGRLQLRVQSLDNGTYQLSPLPRDVGNGKWKGEAEIWDLGELCRQYGVAPEKVGLGVGASNLDPIEERQARARAELAGTGTLADHRHLSFGDVVALFETPEGESSIPPAGPESRPCPATLDGYLCTRGARHPGDHAAHNLKGEMVRRWPQEPSDGT